MQLSTLWKKDDRMQRRDPLRVGLLMTVLAITTAGPALAQQTSPPDGTRRFELGADIGISGNTIDGTAPTVGITGDIKMAPQESIGPLILIGATDNLFQIGVSAQARLTLDIPDVPELKPQFQAGIGFIHADLDNGKSSDSDTSWWMPLGMGVEYRPMKNLYFNTTLLFNFTHLNISNESDHFFITWFVGLRFPF
jgi:hypothetical protein